MRRNKFNFTKQAIRGIDPPAAGKRAYYYDDKVPGLMLSVTDRGVKSFYVYRKVKGRPERIFLGHFPDLTIEQSRGMTGEVNAQIAKGEDPAEKRRALRHEMSLGELFARYMKLHAKPHKKSWRNDQYLYDRHLKDWEQRKLSTIRKTDVQALHAKIGESGKYAANRAYALLHTMYKMATGWGYEGSNPCSEIKKFSEKERERFLQKEELPRFFEAVMNEPDETIRYFILISLLTGARKENVLSMRWDDINFERKEWTMEVKGGRMHTVPIVKPTMAILLERKEHIDSEWVFPSPRRDNHYQEPKKGWRRILLKSQLEDFRIHDLRRSLGSWMAITGASLLVIGQALGHKGSSVTNIYARLSQSPVREAMETAVQAMLINGGVLSPEVIPLIKEEKEREM